MFLMFQNLKQKVLEIVAVEEQNANQKMQAICDLLQSSAAFQ